MSNFDVSPLDVTTLLQQGADSVYVINNTDQFRKMPKGILHLPMKDKHGTDSNINIPKTWIPINLMDYCTIEQLRESSAFRQYVRGGTLIGISAEQAQNILRSPEAQAELQKVRENENAMRIGIGAPGSTAKTVTIFAGGSSVVESAAVPGADSSQPNLVIDSEVKLLVDDFLKGDDDITTSRRVLGIIGDKESWIWATNQIRDTSSQTYLAITDKLGEF